MLFKNLNYKISYASDTAILTSNQSNLSHQKHLINWVDSYEKPRSIFSVYQYNYKNKAFHHFNFKKSIYLIHILSPHFMPKCKNTLYVTPFTCFSYYI